MKHEIVRYYPVIPNGKNGKITHLQVQFRHRTDRKINGFYVSVTPIARGKDNMVSLYLDWTSPNLFPSVCVMSGRYTQKRYEQLKGNLDSLIADALDRCVANQYEYDPTDYRERED